MKKFKVKANDNSNHMIEADYFTVQDDGITFHCRQSDRSIDRIAFFNSPVFVVQEGTPDAGGVKGQEWHVVATRDTTVRNGMSYRVRIDEDGTFTIKDAG